jgi:hypothetical protein
LKIGRFPTILDIQTNMTVLRISVRKQGWAGGGMHLPNSGAEILNVGLVYFFLRIHVTVGQ